MSILNKTIWQYFGQLDYNQSAPPIFMMITKLFSVMFGIKEHVLRFVPFICGIASIPVFYYFSTLFLNKKYSIILTNFLFTINFHLIHYSSEFKQYSSDVLLFMFCCILLTKINLKHLSYKGLVLIGGILGLFPMFSIPTGFVILGFFVKKFFEYKKEILKNILIVFGITFSLWTIYIFSTILPQQSQKFVMDASYWDIGFLTLSFTSILNMLRINLLYYLYPNKFILFDLILLVAGIYYLIRNTNKKSYSILSLSLLLVVVASFLRQYPIYERVSLYLIPVILILIALPLEYTSMQKKWVNAIIIIITIFGLVGYNFTYIYSLFLNKNIFYRNDSRTAMQILKEKYKGDDTYILVNSASRSEFNFYKKYYNFNPPNVIIVQAPNYSKEEYLSTLDMLPKGYKYWFYYAYDYSHSPVIPFLLEYKKGYNVLYEANVGGAYLLNLRK